MKPVQNQLDWVLIAKGIGIILVVVGHFIPESSPGYWLTFRRFVYSFHMPLFFLLSGYLYNPGKYSYPDLLKNKARRLLYPFITVAGIFFVIKSIAGKFVHLDYPVAANSLYALLIDPVSSYMPLLWFIHALFLIFAVYPLLRLFISPILILLLIVCVNAVWGSDFPVVGKAIANMPFFVAGNLLGQKVKLLNAPINGSWRYVLISLLTFILSYAASTLFGGLYLINFIVGVAGSLAVITISHACSINWPRLKSFLLPIGFYSMSIYLLHPLFESAVRICCIKLLDRVEIPFELIALIAIISGVLFPLLLEKYVLRKNALTQKYILGMG